MSYVISLIEAWLMTHPDYWMSWVQPHSQLRYSPAERRLITRRVGGHYRRHAGWAHILPALACTCHHERIATPVRMWTPSVPKRIRHDSEGELIPRKYRVFIWV